MEIYIQRRPSLIEQLTVTTQDIAIGCPPSFSSPLGMAVEKSLASDYRFRSCPTARLQDRTGQPERRQSRGRQAGLPKPRCLSRKRPEI